MKSVKRILTYQILTLPIGIGILLWLLGRQEWQKIWQEFQSINFIWSIPILIITICNYYWRALRWRLLLQAYDLPTVLRAVLIGYWVNLALPRMGELVRIWALQKDKPFLWRALGTVIIERALDVLCLVVLVSVFFATYSPIYQKIDLPTIYANLKWIVLGLVIIGGILVLIFRYLQHQSLSWWQDFQAGLISIRQTGRQAWLWLYTLLIWWSYIAMSYYWFFALPTTAHLDWYVAFALVALGTVSRMVPLQANSAGIYHGLVVMGLVLFGIEESAALALTFLIHTFQLLFILFVGTIAWLWLTFSKD